MDLCENYDKPLPSVAAGKINPLPSRDQRERSMWIVFTDGANRTATVREPVA
jgi:hypothetical protein